MTLELNENRHFYLYAKNWYERHAIGWHNTMYDLKLLQEDYCGVNIDYLTDDMIIGKMIELAYKSMKGKDSIVLRFMENLASTDKDATVLGLCLSMLAITPKSVCGELGEPDYNLLGKPKDE